MGRSVLLCQGEMFLTNLGNISKKKGKQFSGQSGEEDEMTKRLRLFSERLESRLQPLNLAEFDTQPAEAGTPNP